MNRIVERVPSSARSRGPASPRGGRIVEPVREPVSHGDPTLTNGVARAPEPPVVDGSPVAGAGIEHDPAVPDLEGFSGARLLASDVRGVFILLNETRYRTMERLFGVSRADSNLATLIALGVLAAAIHEKAERLMKGPGAPTGADAVLGAASLRMLVRGIAGTSARDTPLLGTLVAIAVLGRLPHPTLGGSLRGIKAFSRGTRSTLNRRYG